MKDKLKQLYRLSEMHSFQVIALVGLVMSLGAHAIMLMLGKQVPSFSLIYPTWAAIFLLGYLLNLRGGNSDHHH